MTQDPADAPPADAPIEERIVFALRVGYLGNIAHTMTTDSHYGGTTDEMWKDHATGTRRNRSTGGTGILHGKPSLDNGPSGYDGNTQGQGHGDGESLARGCWAAPE